MKRREKMEILIKKEQAKKILKGYTVSLGKLNDVELWIKMEGENETYTRK
jgi:hypothetical protein